MYMYEFLYIEFLTGILLQYLCLSFAYLNYRIL